MTVNVPLVVSQMTGLSISILLAPLRLTLMLDRAMCVLPASLLQLFVLVRIKLYATPALLVQMASLCLPNALGVLIPLAQIVQPIAKLVEYLAHVLFATRTFSLQLPTLALQLARTTSLMTATVIAIDVTVM